MKSDEQDLTSGSRTNQAGTNIASSNGLSRAMERRPRLGSASVLWLMKRDCASWRPLLKRPACSVLTPAPGQGTKLVPYRRQARGSTQKKHWSCLKLRHRQYCRIEICTGDSGVPVFHQALVYAEATLKRWLKNAAGLGRGFAHMAAQQ